MFKKIVGNPTMTPYPRPDWNQIKNKPLIGYRYSAVDLADVIYNVFLSPNAVTYVHGVHSNEELNFYVDNGDVANVVAEENVLILDLTEMSELPQISIDGGGVIKWLNGEPPKIEAGKVYMFSFVRAKAQHTTELGSFYFLAIGGEFA
jgi:hypothetical protein